MSQPHSSRTLAADAAAGPVRRSLRKARLAAFAAVATAVLGGMMASSGLGATGHAVARQATSEPAGWGGVNPGTGQPKRGGTLYMLGAGGDVDYMDPNVSYYSYGYLIQRMWIRGLYEYPATPGLKTTQPAPDLATGMPKVSDHGLKYSVTIRSGAEWDTPTPRQVTGSDAVRGIKRACNPAQPFGGTPDYESLIVGYKAYCTKLEKLSPSASRIAAYINSHSIAGVKVSRSNPRTVIFKLTHPATYFLSILTLDSFNPVPAEVLKYVPASFAEGQHTIADGPYAIQSYDPGKTIDFIRNPAWKASSDPLRKAYVDKIVVSETGQQTQIQQELQTNSPTASMEFNTTPPPSALPGLLTSHSPNFNLGPTFASDPTVVFNTVSPNNKSALGKVAVRRALEYAINRSQLLLNEGGPKLAPPLTHVLPPGIAGSKNFNLYSYNPGKAKKMLASAGYSSGLTLTCLYVSTQAVRTKDCQTIQADLQKIGITVHLLAASPSTVLSKYVEVPGVARRGVWDIEMGGWDPDWYGNAALSFFAPLYNGSTAFPPNGSNYGFYNDPKVNKLIAEASTAKSTAAAASDWQKADRLVMQDAAFFPITDAGFPNYHASYVHNAVFIPEFQNFDPTNVWLSE